MTISFMLYSMILDYQYVQDLLINKKNCILLHWVNE